MSILTHGAIGENQKITTQNLFLTIREFFKSQISDLIQTYQTQRDIGIIGTRISLIGPSISSEDVLMLKQLHQNGSINTFWIENLLYKYVFKLGEIILQKIIDSYFRGELNYNFSTDNEMSIFFYCLKNGCFSEYLPILSKMNFPETSETDFNNKISLLVQNYLTQILGTDLL